MLSRFPLHQHQQTRYLLLSKLANISKLTSTARFCSAVSTSAVASSPSNEMNDFLSFLSMRGVCTASNTTRRSAASATARATALAANNQEAQQPNQTTQDEHESENPSNNNTNENNYSNARTGESVGANKSGSRVFCPNCHRKFSSVASLQQHVNARHGRLRKSSKANVKKNNSTSPVAEQWKRLVVQQQPTKKMNINAAKKEQQQHPEKQQTESSASVTSTNITKETTSSRPEQLPVHAVAADSSKKAENETNVVVDHVANTNETGGVSRGITLTDEDRCDLLRAQLELVEATTEALVSWAQRSEKRKMARSQENNCILLPVASTAAGNEMMPNHQSNPTSSSSSSLPSSHHSPFFISKKQPFGNSEFVSLVSRKHLVHKQKKQSPTLTPATMNVCDVGGLSSSSLIGVVTSIKTGTMKSLTAPHFENNNDKQENISSSAADISKLSNNNNNTKSTTSPPTPGQVRPVKPQRATLLEVSCRNFQADKVSGRVSMTKNNITVRIREKSQPKKDSAAPVVVDENNKTLKEESKLTSRCSPFNVGDVLFCQGQLQLHTLFDLASRKWVCNGLVVDVCSNSRNGQVVKILERQVKEENETKQTAN